MAISLTLTQMEAETRRLLGKTDAAKGGADSTTYQRICNQALQDFCLEAEALRTIKYYSTGASDKIVVLDRETIWPISVIFIPTSGQPYGLDLVYSAVPNSSVGNPRVWWPTAANVPDASGPSTRAIGIDPMTTYVGSANLKIECFQLPVELTAGSNVPEILDALHESVCARAALLVMPQYKDKMYLEGFLRREYQRGLSRFTAVAAVYRKAPAHGTDVMGYGRLMRSRVGG